MALEISALTRGSLPFNPPVADYDGPLPSYAELLRVDSLGANYSWGVFGENDELGTLNLITPRRRLEALALPSHGQVINLSLPLNQPDPAPTGRSVYRHRIHMANRNAQDDVIDGLYPQASSQWDGLRHIRAREYGFYNGYQDDEAGPGGMKLGVEHFAERGIITRGVLLDVMRGMTALGRKYDPLRGVCFDVDDLKAVMALQGCSLQTGDLLLVRTGWLERYLALDEQDRRNEIEEREWPGLRGDERMAEFLWNCHIAGVVADNPSVEAAPGSTEDGFLHRRILPLLGFLIGELWRLDELGEVSSASGAYESLVVSVPLNLPGGVGSPANAIAML